MKPKARVHSDDGWAVWRSTTDHPEEIREALRERGIARVYKGDQNQAWDAVLANHCLLRAVGDGADICFFVQDEKLGTPDALLARRWRHHGAAYALTEDYYRGRKGAVWVHQDVSYGLFFTEAVSPEQFAAAAVHLPRTAALWREFGPEFAADSALLKAMEALGAPLEPHCSDAATRLGPPAAPHELAAAFSDVPEAALFYALTRSTGLYGIVPTQDDDVLLSSIRAATPALADLGRRLLVEFAARGAMRNAADARARREVKERARAIARWSSAFLAESPEASVADFQSALSRRLMEEIFPNDRIDLSRTSDFMRIDPDSLDRLAEPDETLHYILDVSLRHPRAFTDAYNEALNRAGFGLQRVKYDAERGFYHPPFFVEFAAEGPGTPARRYSIRLEGALRERITLSNESGAPITLTARDGICSALDLCRALCEGLADRLPVAVVGKAAPFAAELRRWPRALGLPRQGSKYAPMVDHLMAGLQQRGALPRVEGMLLRIGLNALDHLHEAPASRGERRIRLPRFLASVLGDSLPAAEFSARWRRVAADAQGMLDLLQRAEFGQHVHLTRLISAGAQGGNVEELARRHPRLEKLVQTLAPDAAARARLARLGCDVPPEAGAFIDSLLAQREMLLAERRLRRGLTPHEIETRRRRVEAALLLLYAAYVRRLWQRAESLPYLNDRPYSLALYLLFGPEVFWHLCRNVEFDLECSGTCQPAACTG